MTYRVPDRLLPIRASVQRRTLGALMFALLAAIVFAVVLFGGHIADLNLIALGLLLLSLHLVVPVVTAWRQRP